MDEIRNQLKSQSFGDVLPSSLSQVGKVVFPDEPTVTDQMTLQQIINTWSAVHAPTYGNPIGASSATTTAVGAGGEAEVDVLQATKSEVFRIQAISMSNAGGAAPVVAKIIIGGCPIVLDFTANPSASAAFPLTNPLFVDVNSPLKFAVLSGTATDAALVVNYIKTSQ